MKILGIEASSLVASAAILSDDVIIAEYTLNYKKTHSQTLMVMLKEIVEMTETGLSELDAIAVSGGPGSFTGLRIGSTTAKGLGLALDIPLIHVPTLDAMAYQLYHCGDQVCVIMDARRDQVYAGLYDMSGDMKNLITPDAMAITELTGIIAATGRRTVFTGDGVPVHREFIEKKLGALASFAPAGMNRQRAAAVASLGALMFSRGETVSADSHVPVYMRMSQAEREYVSVNECGPEDAGLIAEMESVCLPGPWTEEYIRSLSQNPAIRIFTAKHRDEPAAYCIAQTVAGEGEILRIGTVPSYRRKGVAGRLISAMEKACPDVSEWYLEVRASNAAALGLYDKAGFVRNGRRKGYYEDIGEDAVCMKKVTGNV